MNKKRMHPAMNEDMQMQAPATGQALRFENIAIELIDENPEDARFIFDEAELHSLAASMRERMTNNEPGQARVKGDRYELIVGHRRLRALKILGAVTMLLQVVDEADRDARVLGLLSNLQRVDLSPMELCRAYHRMQQAGDFATIAELAELTGQIGHERSLGDIMSLQDLIPDVSDALTSGEIHLSHAVQIARRTPVEQQRALAACFVRETVSIGSLPEESITTISEKALRAWIKTHLDDPASDEAMAKEAAGKRVDAEKRSDGERALADEGARLAGEDDVGDIDESGDDPDAVGSTGGIPPAAYDAAKYDPTPASGYQSDDQVDDAYDAEIDKRKKSLAQIKDAPIQMCDELLRLAMRKLWTLVPTGAAKVVRDVMQWQGDEWQQLSGTALASGLAVMLCADELNPHMECDLILRLNPQCWSKNERALLTGATKETDERCDDEIEETVTADDQKVIAEQTKMEAVQDCVFDALTHKYNNSKIWNDLAKVGATDDQIVMQSRDALKPAIKIDVDIYGVIYQVKAESKTNPYVQVRTSIDDKPIATIRGKELIAMIREAFDIGESDMLGLESPAKKARKAAIVPAEKPSKKKAKK